MIKNYDMTPKECDKMINLLNDKLMWLRKVNASYNTIDGVQGILFDVKQIKRRVENEKRES